MKKNKDSRITIRLTKEDKTKLEQVAKYNEVSRGNVVRLLLSKIEPYELM